MDTEIQIRPLNMEDIDDEYCSWYENADGHLDFFTGSGRVFNRDALVDDFNRGIKTGKWFYYLIESKIGEKIGNVKIGPIDLRNKTSDLVCLIGNRSFLGRGLASKAISLANQKAFLEHDIRRLQGGMYASNVASIKAYTRAGWEIEAVMKGFYLIDGIAEDRICVVCFGPNYIDPPTGAVNHGTEN